ncbi:hypothetical protein LINPERHAP2_LOCUS23661 [Linum perenne]
MEIVQITGGSLSPPLPEAIRFEPTEGELVGYYLYNYIRGKLNPTECYPFLQEADLYGEKEPWELWKSLQIEASKDVYLFTKVKKKNAEKSEGKNFDRRIGKSGGRWHGEDMETDCSVFGGDGNRVWVARRKRFKYRNLGDGKEENGKWIVHEFSLGVVEDGKKCFFETVVCLLRNNGSPAAKAVIAEKKAARMMGRRRLEDILGGVRNGGDDRRQEFDGPACKRLKSHHREQRNSDQAIVPAPVNVRENTATFAEAGDARLMVLDAVHETTIHQEIIVQEFDGPARLKSHHREQRNPDEAPAPMEESGDARLMALAAVHETTPQQEIIVQNATTAFQGAYFAESSATVVPWFPPVETHQETSQNETSAFDGFLDEILQETTPQQEYMIQNETTAFQGLVNAYTADSSAGIVPWNPSAIQFHQEMPQTQTTAFHGCLEEIHHQTTPQQEHMIQNETAAFQGPVGAYTVESSAGIVPWNPRQIQFHQETPQPETTTFHGCLEEIHHQTMPQQEFTIQNQTTAFQGSANAYTAESSAGIVPWNPPAIQFHQETPQPETTAFHADTRSLTEFHHDEATPFEGCNLGNDMITFSAEELLQGPEPSFSDALAAPSYKSVEVDHYEWEFEVPDFRACDNTQLRRWYLPPSLLRHETVYDRSYYTPIRNFWG